jgi:hypothetical protein
MGLTFSTPLNEEKFSDENQILNLKNMANVKIEENDILDTLNFSEINNTSKIQMPLVGGGDEYTSEGDFAYNFPTRKVERKERYKNYDLFNVITNAESKNNIKGGNISNNNLSEELSQSSSSNHGMGAIKSMILEEINKYKNNKLNSEDNIIGGGDCGCSGEKNILEGGEKNILEGGKKNILEGGKKKKGKKSKKVKKVMKGGISSSESSSANYKFKREEVNETSNDEHEVNEGKGLSIFPLNSEDVSNQTSSERNFRMLRRKI